MLMESRTRPPRRVGRVGGADLQAMRLYLCILLVVVDCSAILLGCLGGNLIRFGDPLDQAGINLFAVVLPIYVGIAMNGDAYASDVLADLEAGMRRAAAAFAFAVLAAFFFAHYMRVATDVSRMMSTIAIAMAFAALAGGRVVVHHYTRARTGMRLVNEVLIADGVEAPPVAGMRMLDALRDDLRPDVHDPLMLDRLAGHLHGVDRVIVLCPPERRYVWSVLLKGSSVNGFIVAEELEQLGPVGIGRLLGRQVLAVACAPLDPGKRMTKRLLDLLLTVPGLIFLSPLLALIALAIRLDSPGPVLFLQPRVGRGNRIFLTYKFRSMRADRTDHVGARSASRDDDRITRVGRIIRRTSLDELPQLLNVLRGEMSLVGPRPHALGSLAGDELFWEVDERYWHRHASKPGLTGLAQVRGYRGETKERADLANRLRADLEYLAGWTIWRDLAILLNTLRVVVHRKAY